LSFERWIDSGWGDGRGEIRCEDTFTRAHQGGRAPRRVSQSCQSLLARPPRTERKLISTTRRVTSYGRYRRQHMNAWPRCLLP
jgi:hypothetical protein